MSDAAFPLTGHITAQNRFLRAKESGRLHHGWIVQGPSGIGKSIFVRRLAALMLGAPALDAPASDPIMQVVAGHAHPDLKWIQRELNEKGQLRQDISVEQIRELNHFFSLKPAQAGWRVGVIDALDEMNVAGLNALLKTLEEPPANAILFLISHCEVPLLATIRSRCQILPLYRLNDADTEQILKPLTDQVALALSLAGGRPGYGLKLVEAGAASALNAAQTLLKSIRKPSGGVVSTGLQAAITSEAALDAFSDALLNWAADAALERPALAQTWLQLHHVRRQAAQMNLTPLQTATKLFATLQNDVKKMPLAA